MPEGRQLVYSGNSGFANVHAYIHGFQQCCSAAIMHGISGRRVDAYFPRKENGVPYVLGSMKMDHVRTFKEWQDTRSMKTPMFAMPWDHAMCAVLEQLYNKAEFGQGGTNMYASSSYATKTWFMADRRRSAGSMSCMNFMNWLKDQGVQQVGRIHISPYRDGAHGGECKGAVYAPNLDAVHEFLQSRLAELNAHADWVFSYYGCTKDNTGNNWKGDEVAQLW